MIAIDSQKELILELLEQAERLQPSDVPAIYELQARHGEPLEESLIRSKRVDEEDIAQAYADFFGLPRWSAHPDEAQLRQELEELESLIPEKICRDRLVAPLARDGLVLRVATVNPGMLSLCEELQLISGLRIEIRVARLSDLFHALDALFGKRDVVREIANEMNDDGGDLQDLDLETDVLDLGKPVPATREGQTVSMVNSILERAIHERASDIHLEAYENGVRVRLRVDGVLRELTAPPRSMFIPMVSRLKILAKMDIAERRTPQDGAFTMQLERTQGELREKVKVDVRVSTVPGVFGEKMVMRLLNKSAIPLEMSRLGLSPRQAEDFREAIHSPHGLVFITGPTGSGKSTTLYTALNILNTPRRNLMTVEDPVEYRFEGINQINVRSQVGLTFASTLRAFLRQDPDVIMVGEVRDQETSEICLRAALTGHLVLSTLHTNDALSAVSRLEDMNIEPFLLASTLRLLQAQRLIRRLCPECRQPAGIAPATARKLGIGPEETIYGPVGCKQCSDSGYRGRLGLFEVIRIVPKLRELIQERASWKELYQAARAEGFDFLIDAGIKHARAGLTSVEEVLSVALAGEE